MKAFTDLEQSKRLAEILPIESADMRYAPFRDTHPWVWDEEVKLLENGATPCWSLAALLDVLPYPIIEQDYNGKWVCRITHNNTIYLWEDYNPVDSCVKMILKLKEENLI